MQQWYLFFCMLCSIVLNRHAVLLANDNVIEDLISMIAETVNFDSKNSCDSVMCKKSINEIVAMFDNGQETDPDVDSLILHIQKHLNKQSAKNNVVNLIVKNEESEKLYAQKNALAKAKGCYFTLRVIIVLVVVIAVCYLVYGYYAKLYGYYKKLIRILESCDRLKNILSLKWKSQ